jgi:radical SAM-linked protein
MISQRLRIEFAKGEAIRFISHLDLMRVWHRTLRRAAVPLAYSEGFVPRPRISLAAPLAVGATGEAELMDIYLGRRMSPITFMKMIGPHLSEGLEARAVEEVPPSLPSLQSIVHSAEYTVSGDVGSAAQTRSAVEESIAAFLAAHEFRWQHRRENETREYDLRKLVIDLSLGTWIDGDPTGYSMSMRLQADNEGTGRPDQVLAAIGLPDSWESIHRVALVLQHRSTPK